MPSQLRLTKPRSGQNIPFKHFRNPKFPIQTEVILGTPMADESQARQNFDGECEAGLNRQINMEVHASYVYLSMACYFDRDDVALPGFRDFFLKSSDEEIEHARKLMRYQHTRGGRVVLDDVQKPESDDWRGGLEAMQAALDLEKKVNQSLLDLHAVASAKEDAQMCDFLQSEFLNEQVEAIKQLSDYVTNLQRVGTDLGEYMFDKETLQGKDD